MASVAQPIGIRELTLRGIVLGALLTLLFTAANVYLGLKLGITFATSIPAAPTPSPTRPKPCSAVAQLYITISQP